VTKHQAKTKANPEWTIQRHWQEEFEDTKEVIRIRSFVLFLLAIVLSFFDEFTNSDYFLGIFKLFLPVSLNGPFWIGLRFCLMLSLLLIFIYKTQ
jgi:hypothetical protein